MTLILGGSGSGKSAYAEDHLLRAAGDKKKYYIATMRPWGAEGAARVKKHRAMREGKGFQTIEAFHTLDALRLPEKGSLMLECMSNLLANEQFELGGTDEEILDPTGHSEFKGTDRRSDHRDERDFFRRMPL